MIYYSLMFVYHTVLCIQLCGSVLCAWKFKVPSLTSTISRHCFEIDTILMGHIVFLSAFLLFKANLPAHRTYCAESLYSKDIAVCLSTKSNIPPNKEGEY